MPRGLIFYDEKHIRSPSYRGNLTFYRAINRKQLTLFYEDALWFAAAGHHSNGQDGNFYQDDSTQLINLDQGNFSTNFVRLGVTSYSLRPAEGNSFSVREIKAHAEVHLSFLITSNITKPGKAIKYFDWKK